MAHIMKIKAADVGNIEVESTSEKYRAKQDRVDPARTVSNRWFWYGTDVNASGQQQTGIWIDSVNGHEHDVTDAVRTAIIQHEQTTGKRLRKDAVGCVGIVITAPPELLGATEKGATRKFWFSVVRFLHERYGENFVGGVLHNDESTPHLHAYVTPVQEGRLNAKKMFNQTEFKTFHDDLQAYINEKTECEYTMVSSEEERAERRKARKGTKGKRTLEELKTATVRAERDLDELELKRTAKKKEIEETEKTVNDLEERKEILINECADLSAEFEAQRKALEQAKEDEEQSRKLVRDRLEAIKNADESTKIAQQPYDWDTVISRGFRDLARMFPAMAAPLNAVANWIERNIDIRSTINKVLRKADQEERKLQAKFQQEAERKLRQSLESGRSKDSDEIDF